MKAGLPDNVGSNDRSGHGVTLDNIVGNDMTLTSAIRPLRAPEPHEISQRPIDGALRSDSAERQPGHTRDRLPLAPNRSRLDPASPQSLKEPIVLCGVDDCSSQRGIFFSVDCSSRISSKTGSW
jgi:hypothetical protein